MTTDFLNHRVDVVWENGLIQQVLDAAFRVHRELGSGLLESVYEGALFYEIQASGLKVDRQVDVPVMYKGHDLGTGFRADLIVEDHLLLELKSVEGITVQHLSQVLTYLKLLNRHRGYILNFGSKYFKDGIKRVSR